MDKDKQPEGKKYTDIDPIVLKKEREERNKKTISSKLVEPPLDYKSEGPGS